MNVLVKQIDGDTHEINELVYKESLYFILDQYRPDSGLHIRYLDIDHIDNYLKRVYKFDRLCESLYAFEQRIMTASKRKKRISIPSHIKITNNKTRKLYKKQKGLCYYCGIKCTVIKEVNNEYKLFTLDHVISKHNGGSNGMDNLVGACFSCNNKKAHDNVQDFMKKYHNGQKPFLER